MISAADNLASLRSSVHGRGIFILITVPASSLAREKRENWDRTYGSVEPVVSRCTFFHGIAGIGTQAAQPPSRSKREHGTHYHVTRRRNKRKAFLNNQFIHRLNSHLIYILV